jgi:uncharacterized membrane protein
MIGRPGDTSTSSTDLLKGLAMAHVAHDDAPKRAQKDDKDGDLAIVGRSVLINRPRAELYAFWRDFTNLPKFMNAIERVDVSTTRSRWVVKAPAGNSVVIETEITEEVDGEVIGWRSVEGSQIETTGRVTFGDAPGNRGTVVTADIGYVPPGGDLGRLVAKLFAAEPNIQARHELKRFKMLMEAGEIATGANRKEQAGD